MTPISATEIGTRRDVVLQGLCPDRFQKVRDVFAAHLASGADIGASVAVYLDGELVVDVWGGFIDPERTRPWQRDPIVNTFSTRPLTRVSPSQPMGERNPPWQGRPLQSGLPSRSPCLGA